MGCFSFMCKECGQQIVSEPNGDNVKLFLLDNGKVIQEMEGEYDSYGRVLNEDGTDSIHWNMDWGDVCNLMFDADISNGIAAIHSSCLQENSIPMTRSEDDPNQGWIFEEEEDEY